MRGLAVAAAMLVAAGAWSAPCDWRWVNPAPPRADLHRVVYAHGLFVAVGAGGTIVTSGDGLQWVPRRSGVTADLYGVEWAGGVWVVVGDGVVVSSTDAATWVVRYSDPGVLLRDVEFGGARFVAVGSGLGQQVLISSDGVHWEEEGGGLPDGARSLVSAGTSFYACLGEEISSGGPDGQFQYLGEVPVAAEAAADGDDDRCDLAWTGSRLLWAGATAAFSSADGTSWEAELEVTEGCPQFAALRAAFADGDLLVVSGTTACPPLLEPDALVYTSSDGGTSWQMTWNEPGEGFDGLASSPSRVVVVGRKGDVLTADDGRSWTCPSAACTSGAWEDGFWAAVSMGDEVAVGGGLEHYEGAKRFAGGTLARSSNGSSWQVAAVGTDRIAGLAWSGSALAAVGTGWAATSADGSSWDVADVPIPNALRAVAWGDGRFLAVGEEGSGAETADGLVWRRFWVPHPTDLADLAWDGGEFVAVGRHGVILSRQNDPLARMTVTGDGHDLNGLTIGGGRYVAVGDGGTVVTSDDGRGWLGTIVNSADDLRDVAWNGEAFVAVGAAPAVAGQRPAVVVASEDGDHWTRVAAPGVDLQAVAPLAAGFVAAGRERTLLYAPCVGPLLELDPQLLRLHLGERKYLNLSLSEAVEERTVVEVAVSDPGVVSAPATVVVSAGTAAADLPLQALALGGTWVTVTLPAEAGGGSTSAWVEVHGSTWNPRHPLGRVRR